MPLAVAPLKSAVARSWGGRWKKGVVEGFGVSGSPKLPNRSSRKKWQKVNLGKWSSYKDFFMPGYVLENVSSETRSGEAPFFWALI